jgi:hypothetical protein
MADIENAAREADAARAAVRKKVAEGYGLDCYLSDICPYVIGNKQDRQGTDARQDGRDGGHC